VAKQIEAPSLHVVEAGNAPSRGRAIHPSGWENQAAAAARPQNRACGRATVPAEPPICKPIPVGSTGGGQGAHTGSGARAHAAHTSGATRSPSAAGSAAVIAQRSE